MSNFDYEYTVVEHQADGLTVASVKKITLSSGSIEDVAGAQGIEVDSAEKLCKVLNKSRLNYRAGDDCY